MNTKRSNKPRVPFSREELEELCLLYMEGSLDRREEKALMQLLTESGLSGEPFDEVLFLMGLSASETRNCGLSADNAVRSVGNGINGQVGCKKLRMSESLYKIVMTCAACVAMIMGVSSVWNYFCKPPENTMSYEVYVDGKKISDKDRSKEIALKTYEESQRFIAKMHEIEAETLRHAEQKKRKMESILERMNSM